MDWSKITRLRMTRSPKCHFFNSICRGDWDSSSSSQLFTTSYQACLLRHSLLGMSRRLVHANSSFSFFPSLQPSFQRKGERPILLSQIPVTRISKKMKTQIPVTRISKKNEMEQKLIPLDSSLQVPVITLTLAATCHYFHPPPSRHMTAIEQKTLPN